MADSVKNEILGFIHCHKCIEERSADPQLASQFSPTEYAQLEVGFTKMGIQIWCRRHNLNVMHIDFEGAQHPAEVGT